MPFTAARAGTALTVVAVGRRREVHRVVEDQATECSVRQSLVPRRVVCVIPPRVT
jgi:hypothetical protein